MSLLEKLRDVMERRFGVRPSKAQIVELAIEELAKAKEVKK